MVAVAVIVTPSPRISGPWVMQEAQRVRISEQFPLFPSVGYHGMTLYNFFKNSGMLKIRFLHGR